MATIMGILDFFKKNDNQSKVKTDDTSQLAQTDVTDKKDDDTATAAVAVKADDDTVAVKASEDEPAKKTDDDKVDDTKEPEDAKPEDDAPKTDDTKPAADDTAAVKDTEDEPAEKDDDTTTPIKDDDTQSKPEDEKDKVEEEPEPVIDLEKPEIRLTTGIKDEENGIVVGFSIQGRSHIAHGIPCQDYHAYETIAPGWKLAITSDGAGSAREAARGSKANCDMAVKLVKQLIESKKWVENNYMPSELEWYIEIRNIFEIMQGIISSSAAKQAASYIEAQKNELAKCEEELKTTANDRKKARLTNKIQEHKANLAKPLEARDFNATIILLLLTPQGMLTAHIGDGRMGYRSQDGTWKSLLVPHKGDEASSTVFIPNNWNRQERLIPSFTMSNVYLPEVHVVKEIPQAFVLMSDGCESFTWQCYAKNQETGCYYDPNVPHPKFFDPLIDAIKECTDDKDRIDTLIDIINTVGNKEPDDRTMIFGILQ